MTDIRPHTTDAGPTPAVPTPPATAGAAGPPSITDPVTEPTTEPTTDPTRTRDDGPTWWRWTRRVFAALLILLMVVSWIDGRVVFLLVFGPMVVLAATVAQRVSAKIRGRLVTGFGRNPLAPESRPYLVQFLIRAVLAVLAAYAAYLAVPRYPQNAYVVSLALVVVPAVIFAWLQAHPARPVSRSLNVVAAIAAAFLAFQVVTVHFRSGLDDAVSIAAPVESAGGGEWIVAAGGRSQLLNHHYGPATPQQHFAIDLLVVDDGQTHQGDAGDPASYHAWDEAIVAPADGTVVEVENGLPDHPIGERETDMEHARGNYVLVEIAEGRRVLLAHLRQGTVTVAEGDRVEAGQVMGRVGNSGNTTEPHLHLQIQDSTEFDSEPFAAGQTFPIHLTDITHIRGGTEHDEQTSQLRRNDIIRVDDPVDQSETATTTQTTPDSESEQP